MKLEFLSLELENFKSFTHPTHLDFKSRGVGLHFLKGVNRLDPQLGSNGAGKSSLFDALCWCLFGQTPDGLRNPDVEPWSRKATTRVTVMFSNDEHEHRVERTARPNRLVLDDKVIGQDEINRRLGLTLAGFCSTILLGQAQPLFFDLKPKAKMELFGEVLDLARWEARSKAASIKTSELANEEYEATRKYELLQAQRQQAEQLITELTVKSDAWLREREDRVAVNEKTLSKLQSELQQVTTGRDGADLAFDYAQTELRPLQKQIQSVRVQRQRLLDQQKLLAQDKCPTCGQPLKNLKLDRRKVSTELKRQTETFTNLSLAETDFQKKSDQAQYELNRLNPQVGELTARIKALKQDSDKERTESNPYSGQIRKMQRQQAERQHEGKDLQQRVKILRRRCERTRFWIKGFKDVELLEVEEVLAELELTTNSMLEEVGLKDWQVQYSVERETKAGTIQRGLAVKILSPDNDKAVRWESWSGGEGQRLRLIGALALSEVLLERAGVTPSLEFLDEPTAHLSTEGVHDLIEYLSERAQRLHRQVFYADQMSTEGAQFTSTLIVSKTDEGSSLHLK